MTRDELLEKINEEGEFLVQYFDSKPIVHSALLAVIELHKPVQSYMFEDDACSHCSSEEDRIEIIYPCQTIQAIKRELA